jgi:hypothetical protein
MGAFESAVTTEPRVAYEAGDFEQVAQEKPKQARQLYAEYEDDPDRRQAKLEADLYTAAFFWPMPEGTEWAPTHGELFRVQQEGPDVIPEEYLDRIKELADRHKFFHWHLEFPGVFSDKGGFDVIIGNPPWEGVNLRDEEFFAEVRPDIAAASTAAKRKKKIDDLKGSSDEILTEYENAQRINEAFSNYLRKSGRYSLTAVGIINTYQVFSGLLLEVSNEKSRCGVVVPTAIVTSDTTKDFFGHIMNEDILVSLYSFWEIRRFFTDTDSREPFCLLTIGDKFGSKPSNFVFDIRKIEEILDERRNIEMSKEDIKILNPNTKTCPSFKNKNDSKICKKIFSNSKILINEDERNNTWKADLRQGIFNMSSDSELFVENKNGDGIKGEKYDLLPLYEAKLFHQVDHRFSSYKSEGRVELQSEEKKDPENIVDTRYYVESNRVDERIDNISWGRRWFISMRAITNSDSRRTIIPSVIPYSGVGHSAVLCLPRLDARRVPALIYCLSSFVVDYASRFKVGGNNLSLFIIKQIPVLEPSRYDSDILEFIVPRVLELTYTSWDLASFAEDVWDDARGMLQKAIQAQWRDNVQNTKGGHRGEIAPDWVYHSNQIDESFPYQPFMWDDERRRYLRAELDGLYAHLYGLNHNELKYVLDTFSLVEEDDIEKFGDYRTKKLILHCFDQLEEAIEQGTAYDPILDLPAIELGDIRPESEPGGDETTDQPAHASTPSS